MSGERTATGPRPGAAAITVAPLERDAVERLLDGVIDLDRRLRAELGASYSHAAWTAAHVLREAPGKWSLSHVALGPSGGVAGFWIASNAQGDAHTHRVAVDRGLRGAGVGRALFEAVREAARALGCRRLTLTVGRDNAAAARFYERLGFRRLDGAELTQFVERRGRAGRVVGDEIEEVDGGTAHRYHAWERPVDDACA